MGVRLSVPAGCWDVQNGLVLYTGTVMTDDGKEKKVNIDFEPFKPINTSLYLCDNKFHTEVNSRPSPCTSTPASLLLLPGCAVTTRYIAYTLPNSMETCGTRCGRCQPGCGTERSSQLSASRTPATLCESEAEDASHIGR
jgi:hypothetical protein